jgi:hypothetical protein
MHMYRYVNTYIYTHTLHIHTFVCMHINIILLKGQLCYLASVDAINIRLTLSICYGFSYSLTRVPDMKNLPGLPSRHNRTLNSEDNLFC